MLNIQNLLSLVLKIHYLSRIESPLSIRIPVDNGMFEQQLLEVHQGQLYSVQQNKIILDQGLIYS